MNKFLKMEQIKIEKNIQVFCIQAESFPDGVMEAFQTMHSFIEFPPKRRNFGISRLENSKFIYKVASEELEKGDLKKHNLEEFTIPAGNYIGITITDFRKDISSIQKAFEQLLLYPNVESKGYRIEEYLGINNVICMVRLKD